jgi:hypothetical protein
MRGKISGGRTEATGTRADSERVPVSEPFGFDTTTDTIDFAEQTLTVH